MTRYSWRTYEGEKSVKPIQVIFLDYGGTLVFSDEGPAEVWRKFLLELAGVDLAIAGIQRALENADLRFRSQVTMYHPPADVFWLDYDEFVLKELGVESGGHKQLAVSINKAFQVHSWTSTCFLKVGKRWEILRQLGYRLGVISNNTEQLPRDLTDHALDAFFDSVTYSAEVGVEKPDPRVFELAIRRVGCAPNEAVHVGDSYEKDVLGARRVGIIPVRIDRERRYLDADCLRINDLRELATVLATRI
jgi:HAD superfamily hydrolase (TIGR01509 family)